MRANFADRGASTPRVFTFFVRRKNERRKQKKEKNTKLILIRMASGTSSMTVYQLKQELRKVGARLVGKKADLVQRLKDYQRNQNFRDPEVDIPAANPMPSWPEVSLFHSLTLNDQDLVPKIREEHVQQYVVLRQVLDRGPNYDHAAFMRGKKMMGSVRALSIAFIDGLCYTSSLVSAEFKDVSYTSRIILHAAGEVLNSDCDCPTGKKKYLAQQISNSSWFFHNHFVSGLPYFLYFTNQYFLNTS